MQCQVKCSPMYWHHKFSLQGNMCIHCILRAHVYISPIFIVSTYLKHCKIKRPIGIANFFETVEPTRICTEKYFVFAGLDHKRRPERFKSIVKASAREMSCG